MNDIDTLLKQLGAGARREPAPDVDVRLRVLRTIAKQRGTPTLDVVPIVFSGVAITVAAILVLGCLPSWQTIFDPWATYLAR